MNYDSAPIQPTVISSSDDGASMGDRIRELTQKLRQERDVQIKATSRILGAAAQLAVKHDRLIDEVVEMVEEDLAAQEHAALEGQSAQVYSADKLKQQFSSLKDAKAHFNLKASGWEALAAKLNQASASLQPSVQPSPTQPDRLTPKAEPFPKAVGQDVHQRLAAIEAEIQAMRMDMGQVLDLLHHLRQKLP
jgi:membrane-bound ClpP family serine protease